MKEPKVSFIIPAYNAASNLPVAVESILSQTFQDWELIIVDDCSSDETYALAESYVAADSRIRLLKTCRQSGGAYIPRKIAIENAKSEIIAPLDADDKVEPDYLQSLLKEMEKGEDVDIVYPIMYRWNGITLGDAHSHDKSLYGIPVEGKEMVKYTLDGWRIHCNGGVIRKSVYLTALKGIDAAQVEVKSYIDECLSRFLLFYARKVVISDAKYYYLENENSITHTTDIRAFGQLWNNAVLLTFIRHHYPSDSEERRLMERQNFHSFFDSIRLLRKSSPNKNELRRIEDMLKASRKNADRYILRPNVSWKYYALYQLPMRIVSFLLP